MAQGLQCWDASGRLIVDIGDYNMRYMGSVNLNVSAGSTTSWSVAWSGMRPTGWLAVMRVNQFWNEFYCIPGTNAFTVQYLPISGVYAQTLTFDIYKYDV